MRFFNSANHQTPKLIKHLFSLGELTQEAINELDKIKKYIWLRTLLRTN